MCGGLWPRGFRSNCYRSRPLDGCVVMGHAGQGDIRTGTAKVLRTPSDGLQSLPRFSDNEQLQPVCTPYLDHVCRGRYRQADWRSHRA